MSDFYYEVKKSNGQIIYGAVTTHTQEEAFKLYLQAAQRARATPWSFEPFTIHATGQHQPLNESIAGVK